MINYDRQQFYGGWIGASHAYNASPNLDDMLDNWEGWQEMPVMLEPGTTDGRIDAASVAIDDIPGVHDYFTLGKFCYEATSMRTPHAIREKVVQLSYERSSDIWHLCATVRVIKPQAPTHESFAG